MPPQSLKYNAKRLLLFRVQPPRARPCSLCWLFAEDEQLLSYGNNLNKLGALRIRDVRQSHFFTSMTISCGVQITHIEWKDSEAAFTISFDSPKLKLEFRTAP